MYTYLPHHNIEISKLVAKLTYCLELIVFGLKSKFTIQTIAAHVSMPAITNNNKDQKWAGSKNCTKPFFLPKYTSIPNEINMATPQRQAAIKSLFILSVKKLNFFLNLSTIINTMGAANTKEMKPFVILGPEEDGDLEKFLQDLDDEIFNYRKSQQPSEETKKALKFVSKCKNYELKKINSLIVKFQKLSSTKFNTQCLILLRNLYLVKSNQIPYEPKQNNELLPVPPESTWGLILG